MSKQLFSKNLNKMPPSMHKSTYNLYNISSYGKHGYLRTKNCACLNSTYAKSNANALKGKDGAIINPLICNKCSNIIYQCQTCGTLRNICTELKAAKRHLRDYHKLENNTVNAIEGNDIEESTEIELAIEGDCDATDLEQDIRNLNLISDLNNETDACREFIKHFHNENAREYLVAISRDKHFSEMRCKNLSKVDVSLQIKLSKLHSLLSPSEQLELAEENIENIDRDVIEDEGKEDESGEHEGESSSKENAQSASNNKNKKRDSESNQTSRSCKKRKGKQNTCKKPTLGSIFLEISTSSISTTQSSRP